MELVPSDIHNLLCVSRRTGIWIVVVHWFIVIYHLEMLRSFLFIWHFKCES